MGCRMLSTGSGPRTAGMWNAGCWRIYLSVGRIQSHVTISHWTYFSTEASWFLFTFLFVCLLLQ